MRFKFQSSFLFSILLVTLLLSFTSALEFEIKPEFMQGETLLAKISGNFIDSITSDKISLYQDHERVTFNPKVKKINNDFYIYGQSIGKAEGNYSLRINEVRYYSLTNTVSSEEIQIPFKINNKTADFLVDPFILEISQNFSVQVQNLFLNKKINITSSFGMFQKTTPLSYGESKELQFSLSNIENSGWEILELKSSETDYFVLVYIMLDGESSTPEPQKETPEGGVEFKISELYKMVSISETEIIGSVSIINPWGYELKDVLISVSENLKEYVSLINTSVDINAESEEKIYFEISPGSFTKELEGSIIVKTKNVETILPVTLIISGEQGSEDIIIPEGESNPNPEGAIENSGEGEEDNAFVPEACISKGTGIVGERCPKEKSCTTNERVLAEDQEEGEYAECCMGKCVNVENSENSSTSKANKIVGGVLVAFLIGFIGWFILKKYKGTIRPIDLLKTARGNKESSKSKISPIQKENEDKVGLEKEFDLNDLPSDLKKSFGTTKKKR